jgi:hypothetical protein
MSIGLLYLVLHSWTRSGLLRLFGRWRQLSGVMRLRHGADELVTRHVSRVGPRGRTSVRLELNNGRLRRLRPAGNSPHQASRLRAQPGFVELRQCSHVRRQNFRN